VTTTLLAVDDSLTMRKVLEITFAGESYKTVLASSAEEALRLAKAERPALALLDHTLQDMSGYDLCRELKSAAPGIAVVILSSKQSPYDKARGSATGVDDFMDKPFDTQKLLDKVGQVLAAPRAAAVGASAARAPAPVAPAQVVMPTASARPRSQTLSYGTPAPAPAAPPPAPVQGSTARTLPGTAAASPAATPRPAVSAAAPRLAAQAAPVEKAPAPDTVARAVAAGNGQLGEKLGALGLTPNQVEGVLALSREVVEKVVWEVVPVLAETIIKEELKRLTAE
jgi:CheY-like chemotaxis protein